MVDKLEKCKKRKRVKVNWYQVYLDICTMDMQVYFYRLLQAHPTMSKNRIAYNVLKSYYSTTALDEIRSAAYGLY